MKVINAKGYVELKLIINYNIQYTCWGLVQKVSSKMYVFVTVTLHISISKRRIQWTFVIANMTSNKFSATLKNFHSPIILRAMTVLKIYLGISVPLFTNSTFISIKTPPKKTGPFIKFSYWIVFPFPILKVVYFERSSGSNRLNIKFQCSNLNSYYSLNLKSEFIRLL